MVENGDVAAPSSGSPLVRGFGGEESRSLMTMRVSRDNGRTWDQETVVREGDPVVLLYDPGRYPPCECARCAGRRTVSARSLRPALAQPGAA